jgi:glycosyltransferase involved in cell wall biosynthesis
MQRTLSIAMCTYNSARYLAAQLESFALQARAPDELVVSDDCSTDATREIVCAFAKSAPFPVRLHVNEFRLGTVANFDRAIGLCSGDVTILADADNYSYPDHLSRLEQAFEPADVGLVFSDAEMVDENLTPLGQRLWSALGIEREQLQAIEGPLGADVLLPAWFLSGACMAFRSEFCKLILPIPVDLPSVLHDGWIAATIAGFARVKAVDQPLLQYRKHPNQQVGVPPRQQRPKGGPLKALRRANSIERERIIAERVYERLTSQSLFELRPGVEKRLAGRIVHARARGSLSRYAARRIPAIATELLSGRYHTYSNGTLSAAKDLVKGPLSK